MPFVLADGLAKSAKAAQIENAARPYSSIRTRPSSGAFLIDLPMIRTSGFAGIIAALRNPNYGVYAAGAGVSLIGTWMQRVATGWLTWELTQSPGWLGIVAFADLAPAMILAPIAGAIADRWDRLWVTRIAQTFGIIQALALFALTVTGVITIWWLVGLVAFLGVAVAINQPSRLALVPSLVPREHLTAAIAINSVIFNMARFIGPAAAGAAIVWGGVELAFAINAVSFVFFLAALARIRIVNPPRDQSGKRSFLQELTDGIAYTARHPGIAPVLMLLIAVCIGARPVMELLPGFAGDVFGMGAEALAALTAAFGAGAVVGGIWLAGRADPRGLTRVALGAATLMAIVTAAFAATDWFWFALAMLVVAGFCMVTTGVALQILIQLVVDESKRGRVMSIYGLIFRGAPALGALAMGAASEIVGLHWPVIAGAALLLGAIYWIYRRRARLTDALEGHLSPAE